LTKNLYKIWSRLGVGFGERFTTRGSIDLECVLLKTSHEGRDDSRLLFGMRGWLLKHHDLINRSRLIRFVKKNENTAVLGGIIDSILQEHPRSGLQYVRKYCHSAKKPTFVFNKVAASSVLSSMNREENLQIWKNWNLISREMDDMRGAIAEKAFVIKNNQNLGLRALFGPGIRAELLNYLIVHEQGNAYKIAQDIGLSYEPVHSELQLCRRIGLMVAEKVGKALIFRIKPYMIKEVLEPLLGGV